MKKDIQERLNYFLENVEILDKRAYFTISGEGEIKRKNMNYSFPAIFFCEDDEKFREIVNCEADKRERVKIKKIDRLSNLEVEKLSENLFKLIIKGELDFAKRYAKELALRDKEQFIKVLFNLSLMDNISFNKPLMALAMREYLKYHNWSDEVGYIVISYFTKQRYDLNEIENVIGGSEESLESITISQIAYKKVLESFEYINKSKYREILNNSVKRTKKDYEISEIEKMLIKGIKEL